MTCLAQSRTFRRTSLWLVVACGLVGGCDRSTQPANSSSTVNHAPPALAPEHTFDGKVVLGSPRLTAGIPGQGPLTIEQIRAWLDDPANHEPLDFTLPLGLRNAIDQVYIPSDNPLTRAKIELGRQLFFERRLSPPQRNISCADCHPPVLQYSFGKMLGGLVRHPRGAPPVFNRILSKEQFWDGRAASLEDQVRFPIENPIEMGLSAQQCVTWLKSNEGYRLQFGRIFGEVTFLNLGRSLASFERALVTGPSAWDFARVARDYAQREPAERSAAEQAELTEAREGARAHPMSDGALLGETIFFSERARCGVCHRGANLTDEGYHNVGVGSDEKDPDPGRFEVTRDPADFGALKTPTLRNIAETASYMHFGQLISLRDVVDWFDRGGCADGGTPCLPRLGLSEDDKRHLVEFMQSLTGDLPVVQTARLPP